MPASLYVFRYLCLCVFVSLCLYVCLDQSPKAPEAMALWFYNSMILKP